MQRAERLKRVGGVVAAAMAIGVGSVARAVPTFTGGDPATPTTWNDKLNWSTGTIPGGSNNVLFDDASDPNLAGATITTGNNQAALQLQFGDNAGDALTQSFTLAGNTILLAKNGTGTIPVGLLRNASGTQTVATNLTLGKTQSWAVTGTGSLVVSGVVGDGGSAFGLTKTGGGTLELAAANAFSGPFTLQGGTVVADTAAALGADTTDPVLLNAANSDSNATLLLVTGVTLANSLTVQANANGKTVTIGSTGAATGTAAFAGPITLNANLTLDATSTRTLTLSGVVADGATSGAVTKIDGGTVVLSAANTFSGGFTARGGTTIVSNNAALGSAPTALVSGVSSTTAAALLTAGGVTLTQAVVVQSSVNANGSNGAAQQYGATLGGAPGQTASTWAGNVTVNQPVTLTAGGSVVTFAGGIADGTGGTNATGTAYAFAGSDLTKVDAGTVVLAGRNTYSGATTVSAGTLAIATTASLPTGTNLTVAAGATLALATGGGAAIVPTVGSLTLAPAGRFDIANGALVVRGTTLAAVTAAAAAGYGAGGIVSSAAAADAAHLTAVGVIANDDGTGNPLYGVGSSFDGTSPNPGDVLVRYTYFGDANLDGKVDGLDYGRIDAGYASGGGLTGWYNGDFNYDGVVDGSDYTLIDNAFNLQAASPSLAAATAEVAAVPEPAGLIPAAAAISFAIARRRRVAR